MAMAYKFLDATGNWSDPASTTYKYLRADGQWVAPDSEHLFLDATGNWSAMESGNIVPWTLYSDGTLVINGTSGSHGSIKISGTLNIDKNYQSVEEIPWYINHADIVCVEFTSLVKPKYTARWFDNCSNLITVKTENLDTSNVIDMTFMFYYCTKLTTLDVSNWNTSNVTNVHSIFLNCKSLEILDVDSWDTSNVTDMFGMFYFCSNLTTIYCNNTWKVSATNSENMFDGCTRLKGAISYDANKVDATYANPDTGYFTRKPVPDDFSGLSWADIEAMSQDAAKNPEKYLKLVGKEKTFEAPSLGGTFTAVCMDIAHFDKADESGKAGFLFQFKETTNEVYNMNDVNTNVGGYAAMDMHKTTLQTTIFNALPAELQSAIREVKIPYNTYNGSGIGDSAFSVAETTAKLFLPSNREVYGTTPLNGSGSDAGEAYRTGEDGTQFAYWAQHPTIANHVKYRIGTETAAEWWCRSCHQYSARFVFIDEDGHVNYTSANYPTAIAPCYCI